MAVASPVLLPRTRLHDRLDNAGCQLTVIAGPSGSGKTSLTRAWVATLETDDIVWVTLENDLESRSAFWQTVLAGATRRRVTSGPSAAPDLVTEVENSADPAAVIARGLAEADDPLLVVDAYEKVREAAAQVDDDLMRLVRLVPHLRVVVTTRTSSGLASPARSLRGEVQLLTEADLAFTLEETQDLLDAFADPEVTETAERLHRATHGYPLALRAALLSLATQRPAPRHPDDGWRSLVAEDLRMQLGHGPAYSFVLATSVPPYLDAELASELSGPDSNPAEIKEMLDDLEWNGFGRWIPFAPGEQVFQYVESLRDAMLNEAQQRPREERLHAARLSAMWLHVHGSHEAALELAVSVGLFDVASRVYAAVLVTNQNPISASLVDRHLAQVPSRALSQYPTLAFGRGLACFRDPNLRGAALDYFKITAAWDARRNPNPTAAEYLLGFLAKTVSLRVLGRIEESAQAAEEAAQSYDTIPDNDGERSAPLRPLALRHLAYSLFLGARLESAREVTMRAVALATGPITRNQTAVYAVGFGALEGRIEQARTAQNLVDLDAWRPGEAGSYANALGLIGEATMHLDAFDFADALATYDGCDPSRDIAEFWPFYTWTLLHAHLGLGSSAAEARQVEDLLQHIPAPPLMADNLGSAMVRSALALSWLAAGNRGKAAPLLRTRTRYAGQLAPAVLLGRLLGGDADGALLALPRLQAQRGHTVRSSSALLALGAAAAVRAGREDTAGSLLERMVRQIGQDGARLHLAYLPAADLDDLRRVAADRGIDAVRAYLSDPVPAIFSGEVTTVSLTNQERAVVLAMTDHPSRTAVAAALHVSENTVKTHLQRIYRKLGVNSRATLIQRAIELDLLDPS